MVGLSMQSLENLARKKTDSQATVITWLKSSKYVIAVIENTLHMFVSGN